MMPLTMLEQWGLNGPLRAWVRRGSDGRISDALFRNAAGLVMPQCPTGPWPEAAAVLAELPCSVVLGPKQQVRALVAACGLGRAAERLDRDEPFLTLDLADLQVPPGPGRIVPIADAPREIVVEWLRDYLVETLALAGNMAMLTALENYDAYRAAGSHVVLMESGVPLSMTGFSAHQPRTVQVDGVYTPPEFRNMGLARRAVALHLDQARQAGIGRAVLSASGAAAVRSYKAIGFRHDGLWSLCMFQPAQTPRLTALEPAT